MRGQELTVEGEWLNGVPHGICIFEHKEYRGINTFNYGKVDGGPVWFEIKESGDRLSLEYGDSEN